MKKIIDKIISVICILLIVFSVILVIASIILKSSDKVVFVGKYAVVKITTASMNPTIEAGSYILLEKAEPSSLQKGDIITFYSEDPSIYGSLNTHRINNINNGSFVTKGDNNNAPDAYTVKYDSVVGKYKTKLVFFKSMMNVLSNPFAYFVMIIFPIIILVFISIKDVINITKKQQNDDILAETIEKMKQNGELEQYLNSSANSDKDLENNEIKQSEKSQKTENGDQKS